MQREIFLKVRYAMISWLVKSFDFSDNLSTTEEPQKSLRTAAIERSCCQLDGWLPHQAPSATEAQDLSKDQPSKASAFLASFI
jgi:hypothetical protein